MSDRSAVIYCYDGSFDGFLCCVFESYTRREIPLEIYDKNSEQISIFPPYQIQTDPIKASRIKKSIPLKMGNKALVLLQEAFLTCLEQKEIHLLNFMYLGYQYGNKVMQMLTNHTVATIYAAVGYLKNEINRYQGFVRFSVHKGIMLATIQPKNYVLPILGAHFRDRFPSEQFLLYDQTHKMVCIYEKGKFWVSDNVDVTLPKADDEELYYRNLWRMFYNTIAIKERKNPKCQLGHMPKRYWSCMTEHQTDDQNTNNELQIKQNIKLLR